MSTVAAIKKAIELNVKRLPEYTQSKDYETRMRDAKVKGTELGNVQAQANIDQTYATTKQTTANTAKIASETKQANEKYEKESKIKWKMAPSAEQDMDGYTKQFNEADGTSRYTKTELVKTDAQWKKTTGIDLMYADEGTIIPSQMSTPAPNGGKWCGEFANDLAGHIPVGETKAERTA